MSAEFSRYAPPDRNDYADCECRGIEAAGMWDAVPCGGCEEYRAARDEWHAKVDTLDESDDEEITSW